MAKAARRRAREALGSRAGPSQEDDLQGSPESAGRSRMEISLRDRHEAASLNGDRSWAAAVSPPITQWMGRYEAPRDSQGRLHGSGYEASDHDFYQSPEGENSPADGSSAVSAAVVESLSDRIAKRRRLASPDEIEAEELNSLS